MSRLIINNQTDLSDQDCLGRVYGIMNGGLISQYKGQPCYCLCSVWNDGYVGYATITAKGTYVFDLRPDVQKTTR